MGKRNKEKVPLGSASRRRAVLQIEPVSRRKDYEVVQPSTGAREINPTSISGIGLLGQYADYSDDEDQNERPSDQTQQIDTDTAVKNSQPQDDKEVQIDSKLVDFFKEIEAISTEEATPPVEIPNTSSAIDESNQEQEAEPSADNSNASYTVPYPWEEVYDPNTNYVYYWNTLTNEVSWEMPQIIPEAPLQLPEQHSKLTEQEPLSETWSESLSVDNVHGSHQTTNDEEETWVPPEPTESSAVGGQRSPAPESDVMPSTTPGSEDAEMVPDGQHDDGDAPYDDSLPDDVVSRRKKAVLDMFQTELGEDHQDRSSPADDSPSLPLTEAGDSDSPIAEETAECPPTPEDVSNCTPDSPVADDRENDDQVTAVNDLPEQGRDDVPNSAVEVDKDDEEIPAKKARYDSDHGSDEDFAEKLLEEFLEGKSSEVEPPQEEAKPPQEETKTRDDMEPLHEDMEVESDSEGEVESVVDDQTGPLLPPEAFKHNKLDGASLKEDQISLPADSSSQPADKLKDQEDEKVTDEIFDLSGLITSKLDFLNITKNGLNKLQVVLLQMETRVKDWREGALSSQYLVKRLRDADEELTKYEKSAAPDGWSCHWDSTYKRYFYTDDKTGESQWDYPQVPNVTSAVSSLTANPTTVVWGTSNALHSTASTYNTLTATLDHSQVYGPTTAIPATYPTDNPQIIAPVVVTQDPYRIDDSTPDANDDDDDVGEGVTGSTTPPPPGESPPPPPPPDLPTIPPPPPPPSEEPVDVLIPAPPPSVLPPIVAPQTNSPVHFAQRTLTDYSDLDPSTEYESVDGQGNLTAQVKDPSNHRSSPVPMTSTTGSKTKKKKTKSGVSSIRSSKEKKMSSLVQKWQAIKKQDEEWSEGSDEEDRTAKSEANIEQWRQEQIVSGQAAKNPNFQEIKGDWRERVRKAKMRSVTDVKPDSPNP